MVENVCCGYDFKNVHVTNNIKKKTSSTCYQAMLIQTKRKQPHEAEVKFSYRGKNFSEYGNPNKSLDQWPLSSNLVTIPETSIVSLFLQYTEFTLHCKGWNLCPKFRQNWQHIGRASDLKSIAHLQVHTDFCFNSMGRTPLTCIVMYCLLKFCNKYAMCYHVFWNTFLLVTSRDNGCCVVSAVGFCVCCAFIHIIRVLQESSDVLDKVLQTSQQAK